MLSTYTVSLDWKQPEFCNREWYCCTTQLPCLYWQLHKPDKCCLKCTKKNVMLHVYLRRAMCIFPLLCMGIKMVSSNVTALITKCILCFLLRFPLLHVSYQLSDWVTNNFFLVARCPYCAAIIHVAAPWTGWLGHYLQSVRDHALSIYATPVWKVSIA